eukprot:12490173-Alexandrium_andersonii.AAC.1
MMLPPPGPWGRQWSPPPGSQQQAPAAREAGQALLAIDSGPAVRRVFAGPREADGGARSRSPARSTWRHSRRRDRSRRPSPAGPR